MSSVGSDPSDRHGRSGALGETRLCGQASPSPENEPARIDQVHEQRGGGAFVWQAAALAWLATVNNATITATMPEEEIAASPERYGPGGLECGPSARPDNAA